MEGLFRSLSRVEWVISTLLVAGFAAAFVAYFVFKTPMVFLVGVVYVFVVSKLYSVLKDRLKKKYVKQLGVKFYTLKLTSEYSVNLMLVGAFFLAVGLVIGVLLGRCL